MDLPDYSAHIRYDEWMEIGSPEINTPEDWYNAIMAIYELHPTTDEGEQRYTLACTIRACRNTWAATGACSRAGR